MAKLPNTIDAARRSPIAWRDRHNFFDWLLCLLFPRFDIVKLGRPYMRRWFIGPAVFGRRIMAHRIEAPDFDGIHDHPWDAIFWIVWGGYLEELVTRFRLVGDDYVSLPPHEVSHPKPRGDYSVLEDHMAKYRPALKTTVLRRPGLRYHDARQPHRILRHVKEHTWTIVFAGARIRGWGFWNAAGVWVPWRRFVETKPDQTSAVALRERS